MKSKVDKKSKLSLETIASLLASILTILWILSNWIPPYQKWLKLLSESLGISSMLLQLLILLTLFVILTLFLSILCIFKKEKTTMIKTINPKIIEKNPISDQMINIIKLLRNDNQLFTYEIKDKLSFTSDEISYYTRVLWLDKQFITRDTVLLSNLPPSHRDHEHSYNWKLSDKGISYLVENNL